MKVLSVSKYSEEETVAVAFSRDDIRVFCRVFGLVSDVSYEHNVRQEYVKIFNDNFVTHLENLSKAFRLKEALKIELESFNKKLTFLTD